MIDGFGGGEEAEAGEERPRKKPRREVEVDDAGEVVVEEAAEDAGEWQEKEDFELEQEDVLAPLAEQQDEQPQVGEGNGEPVRREEADLDVVDGEKTKPVDKKERKKLKKQRAQEEKKAREEERKKKAT